MEEKVYRLPLGLCKQATMKLDAFLSDIHEILEDEDLKDDERQAFHTMIELGNTMMSHLVNIVSSECDETDFMNEDIPMDEIADYDSIFGEDE